MYKRTRGTVSQYAREQLKCERFLDRPDREDRVARKAITGCV